MIVCPKVVHKKKDVILPYLDMYQMHLYKAISHDSQSK